MKNQQHTLFLVAFLIVIFVATSCTSKQKQQENQNLTNEKYLVMTPDEYHDLLLTKGELVYVPVYSEIYGANLDRKVQLSATLSIRNISMDCEIVVSTVEYYDTHGKLIKQYLSNPVVLKPLETLSYLVQYKDTQGGDGANFIVEWVSEQEVAEPIIEAVMIGATSALGISFISQGKVIKYLNE